MWRCQGFAYSGDHEAKLEESELAVDVHANQNSQSTEVFVPWPLHHSKSQKPIWILHWLKEIGEKLFPSSIQVFFCPSCFAHAALFVTVAAWQQCCYVCPLFKLLIHTLRRPKPNLAGPQGIQGTKICDLFKFVRIWRLCWSTHPWYTHWPCAHMLADNTDQIKLALTIATRKRSITQPVHFSAEGSKSMAISTLRDLCLREQEISPHTDSRDMEQLSDEQNWKNWSSNCGKIPLLKKKSQTVLKHVYKIKKLSICWMLPNPN